MVGISKALETYSEALTSSWRNLDTTSLENIVKQLLTFAWDHFSYNVEVKYFHFFHYFLLSH